MRECGGCSTGSCLPVFLLQISPGSSRKRRHKVWKCTPSIPQREGKLCKTVPCRDKIHLWQDCAWKTVYRCFSVELRVSCMSANGVWVEKQLREVMAPCFICHGSPKLCTSQLTKHTIWEEVHSHFQHVKGNHGWREGATTHWLLPSWGGPSCILTFDSSHSSQPCTQDMPDMTKWEQVDKELWELRYSWPRGVQPRAAQQERLNQGCNQRLQTNLLHLTFQAHAKGSQCWWHLLIHS